jgi:hypothetical protein
MHQVELSKVKDAPPMKEINILYLQFLIIEQFM